MSLKRKPTVRERTYPSGKTTYEVDYAIGGKRIRKIFGTRKDLAEAYAAKVFVDYQSAKAGIRSRVDAPSLPVLAEKYMHQKVRRTAKSTQERYQTYADQLLAFFSDRMKRVGRIDQITKGQLEAHIDELVQKERANKTLNGHVQFIRSLFAFAVEEDLLDFSPAEKLKSFSESNDQTPPYWEEDEVQLILKKAGIFWRDAFAFLYHTGLRKEELIQLCWKDVNLETDPPTIIIQGKKDWRTKTNRVRTIPLSKDALEIVKRQVRSKLHDRVFSGPNGLPIHRDKIYQALKLALRQLQLEGDVHQWRHTFATHLVKNGVGIEKVSKLLGHSTLQMTMRYAHVATKDLKLAVDCLPRIEGVKRRK